MRDSLNSTWLLVVILAAMFAAGLIGVALYGYSFPATQCSETMTGRMHAKQNDAGQGAQITGKEWMIVCARSEWR